MNWTSEHYATVRERLPESARTVFDRLAYAGKRLREALDGAPTTPAVRKWRLACEAAGAPAVPSHRLRLDYITTALEARRGND